MKYFFAVVALFGSTVTWASPLQLKCTINQHRVSLDIDSLVSDGCKSKALFSSDGQFQTRYDITLCNSRSAYGTVSVLKSDGDWIAVDGFSTDQGCRLWREIETDFPCTPNRHRHTGGC